MRFLALTALVATGPSWAADTTSPPASGTEPEYKSTFADFRGFKDEPVMSWRDSNDRMRRLGGHAGHLGETMPPGNHQAHQQEGPDKKPSGGR